ncbi:acyl carrier protein [Scytonema sp. PCC 10023]|uniref:acyl carrier protein n=1 Tax=Scytonema sp. PCC 10023 TaxID=1680591 RepID=UPI0039C67977
MVIRYPMTGDNKVETVYYTLVEQGAEKGQVFINQTQYFEGVPLEVWNFRLGGYQICHKWLQSHQGSYLSHKEIQQYQRVILILKEIIELMVEIETAIQFTQQKNRRIFEKLQVIIAEQLGIEQNQVSLTSSFRKNLGADSLDMLELVVVLEKIYNIEISDEIIKEISTVQKLVNYISQKMTSSECAS